MAERSVLVTGGTTGIGYYTSLRIARQYPSYQVILASRTDSQLSAATINKTLGQNNSSFMQLDLGSLKNVRAFADEWKAKKLPPIEFLFLNAGVQFAGDVSYSVDGFEETFAINHLGHALLFSLLYPYLADDARILVTSSGTHDPEQKTLIPDAKYNTAEELAHPKAKTAKNPRQRYSSSKLVNVLWSYALNRRLRIVNEKYAKNLTVADFDPGLMPGTKLARDAPLPIRVLFRYVMPHMIPLLRMVLYSNIHSPEESGSSLVAVATDPIYRNESGVYYEGTKKIPSSKDSYNESKQEDLWNWTIKTLAKNEDEKKRFELI
ncbi:hypothetical protein V1511DRAFT_489535 [Dipodascopsis uninucleata]